MTSLTPPKQYKLLVMGNPLLDIQVVGDEELLKRYDLKANDSILAEEKHKPLYQELIEKYEPVYVAGGAAQNAARGAQYLLPPKSTVYIGCVGNDHLGQQIRKAAEKDGLRVEYMVLDDVPTGTCGVIITGHHRSLVANLSAAEKYSVNDLKAPGKWKLVEYADYYYIGGFFLTVSPESILEVAKHANENNKIFSMNLSAPFICQYFTQRLDEVTPYWDIIFGNETEAETYAKVHNWEITDTSEIARKIAQLPKNNPKRSRIAVITQGSNPTIVAYQDGTIREFAIIPIDEKDIVDTNGAGDAFVGGFLSQYVQGASIERSVKAGHWLANLCIQQVGPAYPQEKYVFVE